PAAVALDDRTTNRQTDSHPIIFGGVERVEKSLDTLRFETHARVFYDQARMTLFLVGLDQKMPGTVVHLAHRGNRVSHQVENDLLKLDTIAGDEQRVIV